MLQLPCCKKSTMFGFHGWLHLVMVAVIAILIKRCIEIPDVAITADPADDLPAQTLTEEPGVTPPHAAPAPAAEDEASVATSVTFLTKASTFIVDSTMSTLMSMSPAAMFEEVTPSESHDTAQVRALKEDGSSVWCWGSHHTDRICRFRNLCYFPKEDDFVFLHSPNSVVSGVPSDRFSPTLLDMSSVHDHNMQYFNYVDLPASQIAQVDVEFIDEVSLIFRRFNPDNLMHVIHDDLLPMFHTLQMIHGNASGAHADPFDVQLVFMEGWSAGDYIHLYEVFSRYKPIFSSELQARSTVTCFADAYVGITKATTWYQYGFRIPQGPIPDRTITSHEIRQFTHYMRNRLHDDSVAAPHANGGYVVLFSRKHNRVIINEVDLTMELARNLKMKIVSVGTETHSIAELIEIVNGATVLIGMHGSLLSLAMFLPPGAILVELFPYGVNPEHYTPYKTLATLPGMALFYRSWRNTIVTNTVTYPERPWDTGGLVHLTANERNRIIASPEVPRHLCCRDPEWLFRIYQDTIVDIPSLHSIINNALEQHKILLESDAFRTTDSLLQRIYPAYVIDLKCSGADSKTEAAASLNTLTPPSLHLSWQPPWNINYLGMHNVKYEVWIQETGQEHYTAWILSRTSYQFTAGLKPQTTYSIWVRCLLNDAIHGPFNIDHVTCST